MSVEKKIWIYDLEQLPNFHSGTFIDRDSNEKRVFVLHQSRNNLIEYIKFLEEEVAGLIGFNCVNYDYPLLHLLIGLASIYTSDKSLEGIIQILHEESQRIIKEEYSAISEKDTKIPQLDLYRIHHFDNKAKRTSLKAVEIAINFPNIQDIPFDENHEIIEEEIPKILDYNENDVLATKKFYFLSEDLVELRKRLSNRYKINLRNANDPKIGQEIFGREIARKTGIRYDVLKNMRTYRRWINLNDCILDKISFKSEEFNKMLKFFKSTTIVTTYKAFEQSVIYKGFKYDYGTGGLHGCIEPGIYEADDDHIIVDIDVASYYPNLAIVNGFYPRHLGKGFVEVYAELFEQRIKAKATGDQAMNSGLKLALNGVYGKSNDQYSLFYDPMYTMRITINGQLLLSMLAERLVNELRIPPTILQVNTDGITIKINREMEAKQIDICERWENETRLILEYASYKKMIIRDVNNYLAETIEGKIKAKGCFEIIPTQNGAIAYNKNWSMRIVPKALHEYYLKGIPFEEFIRNHDYIYDFCIGFRAREPWDIWATVIESNRKVKIKQQRTLRYFMSRSGVAVTKENREDGRIISLEAGRTVRIFNEFVNMINWDDYDIDYNYYIKEVNKIKNAVDDGQLKLF